MTPISSAEGINLAPEVVIPIVLVAVLVAVLAILGRQLLVDILDELVELVRTYGPVATNRALDHRPGLARTPWLCATCRSINGVAVQRCYKCGARREDAEETEPEGEIPAGPSAGLTQRTRTRG